MGIQQHTQGVGGTGGEPIRTNAGGVLEVDNYGDGGAFDHDGSAYPYTLDPEQTIQELIITTAGDIVARITTVEQDTFDLPLAGARGAFDKWEIESVEFRDPNATASRIAGGWAGE
jgi:hypothetical protein